MRVATTYSTFFTEVKEKGHPKLPPKVKDQRSEVDQAVLELVPCRPPLFLPPLLYADIIAWLSEDASRKMETGIAVGYTRLVRASYVLASQKN